MRPIAIVTAVIPMPKRTEAIMSPRTIASIVTGQDASRSRVLADPSQGKMAGETAVAVKKRVMATRPETRKASGSCRLPMRNARKRKTGMKTPKISTGPLR